MASIPKRYHIYVSSPNQPLRQARTLPGAKLVAAWCRLLTFGLKTIVITDTVEGRVISRG